MPEPLGPQLTNPEEILYRQVHPSFFRDGRPTSQAFCPTPKDDGQLSVSRGGLTTSECAYHFYTKVRKLQSNGVWGITVGECAEVELKAYEQDRDDDTTHAAIDFNTVSKSKAEKIGRILARRAADRGRLYP